MITSFFTGRLGKDPEIRQAGEHKIVTLGLATDTGYGQNKKTVWAR